MLETDLCQDARTTVAYFLSLVCFVSLQPDISWSGFRDVPGAVDCLLSPSMLNSFLP